ncbi:MAG: response regulator transcription factor [Alphaproteobacteria bacterium]
MRDTPVDNAAPRVFVVDDDELFRESLIGNLKDAGFSVTDFDSGIAVLEYLKAGTPPDLILLDWKMPQVNGIDVLRQLRRDGTDTPVIFLTHLSDQIYEEAALSSGAVDFVEKSRSFPILQKRMELILANRRGGDGAQPVRRHVESGPLRLDLGEMTARWKGTTVALDAVEFGIVRCLVEHESTNIRARELYAAAHNEDSRTIEEGFRVSIRNSVRRIQSKFRDVDATCTAIEDDPDNGYRWRGDSG